MTKTSQPTLKREIKLCNVYAAGETIKRLFSGNYHVSSRKPNSQTTSLVLFVIFNTKNENPKEKILF